MNAQEQRLWDLLSRELERTIKRMTSADFPTDEDRNALRTIGTFAGELGRKPPISLDILSQPLIAVDTRTPDGKMGPFAIWSDDSRFDRDRKLAEIGGFLAGAWLPLCKELGSVVLTANATKAMHALAECGSLLGRQLVEHLDIGEEKNLGRAIKPALDRGLIVNAGDKDGYRLSDSGMEWVRQHPEESSVAGEGNAKYGDGNMRGTRGTAEKR